MQKMRICVDSLFFQMWFCFFKILFKWMKWKKNILCQVFQISLSRKGNLFNLWYYIHVFQEEWLKPIVLRFVSLFSLPVITAHILTLVRFWKRYPCGVHCIPPWPTTPLAWVTWACNVLALRIIEPKWIPGLMVPTVAAFAILKAHKLLRAREVSAGFHTGTWRVVGS